MSSKRSTPKKKMSVRNEWKIGMDVVGKTLTDAQALTLVNANKEVFDKVDDSAEAAFCKQMESWREDKPDVYEAFWWWRKANQEAAKASADDDGKDHRTKGRVFEIMQYLAKPFDEAWEDDRRNLKDGYQPLITEEQIEAGLDHRMIKRWAWGWHGRDIYDEIDEATARPDRPIKAGDRKFLHVHIYIDVPAGQYVDVIARWFGVPESFVEVKRGRGAFLDCVEYLFHESPKAVERNKTHYDDDEMHASPGFDFRKELTDLQAHRAKYGKRAGEMTPADTMRMHVLDDGWTMRECRADDPLTYSKIRSSLPPLRLDYLREQPPCAFRINIYVDGNSGLGKSSFCQGLGESLFRAYERPSFTIGNDERVTFEGYDGEPVIIWEEMRAADFVRQFGPKGVLTLLDNHPKQQSQQVKGSSVILTNAVNIINGIQPYGEFLDGVAGEYTDRFGVHHYAENDTQVYRRMPIIIRVREDDFDILLNKGFMENDLFGVKQFTMYKQVTGSIKRVMEQLDGAAKAHVVGQLTAPALEAVDMVRAHHDDEKVSDVEALPEEFSHYGETIDGEEVMRRRAEKAEQLRKAQEETNRTSWLADRYEYFDTYLPLYINVSRSHGDAWMKVNTFEEWSRGDGHGYFPNSVYEPRVNGFDRAHGRFYRVAAFNESSRGTCESRLHACMKEPFAHKGTHEVLDGFVVKVRSSMDGMGDFYAKKLSAIVAEYEEFMHYWAEATEDKEDGAVDSVLGQGVSIDSLFPND